jgi:NAD(P)-dependent dehydrogenase (short-subunit alcohol dehydrogenase family)
MKLLSVNNTSPVAVVTGSSRGIGAAACRRLLGRGWQVVGLARTRAGPDEVEHVPADLNDDQQSGQAIRETIASLPRLDGVVHAAGVAPLFDVDGTSDSDFDRAIRVNLRAAFVLARAAWPKLKASRGVIVNVASLSATDPFPGFGAYAASKAGLIGLTKALAAEGRPLGIASIAVSPGAVDTRMLAELPMDLPPDLPKLSADEVGEVIVACLTGSLRHASGTSIELRPEPRDGTAEAGSRKT